MRTIGVVTVGRSDYGIYLPLLRRIRADSSLRLHLIASGMHMSPEFGLTVGMLERDGFEVAERLSTLLLSDTPHAIAASIGIGTQAFAGAFARNRPDILVVLGDRFDMYSAALAALPFKLPVAHIHGGELTEGAIDDALRHSMTKLSHLHFVATEEYAARVVQLGEEPWRVTICGALGLDNLQAVQLVSAAALEAKYGWRLSEPPLLVTFHPATLEFEHAEWQARELVAAVAAFARPLVITLPNADTSGRTIARVLREFAASRPATYVVDALGTQDYFSVMSVAAAMVGNSSSGILEAPSFELPVVNVGRRQQGRVRAANVIDVGHGRGHIIAGIERAVDPAFRGTLRGLQNPYRRGDAAATIVATLTTVPLDDQLTSKRFHDITVAASVATQGRNPD